MQAPLQARNASAVVQTKTEGTATQRRRLVDNRPAAVAQSELAEMMNNSPRVLQQRALSNAIHHSPRMLTQRHEIHALFGATSGVKQLKAGGAARPIPPGGAVVQAYNIKYGALQHGAGTDMHVYINGKNDADLQKGSKPSVVPFWWPAAGTHARNYLAQYAVQGHLLNEHLGGPGSDMANLTPITKSTNTTHFQQIEHIVKQAIAADYGVEYRVRATYGNGPSLADFGPTPPAGLANVLPYFADTIGADYDIYDRHTLKKLKGAPGELLIKNEGKHMKGTF